MARDCVIAARLAGYETGRTVFADAGYRGQEGACAREGIELRVVTLGEVTAARKKHKRLNDKRFVPLPKRWVIERTFGILSQWRALRVSHERRSDHVATSYLLANTLLLANRF